MKKKRYTDEQIAFGLRQAEAGTPVEEICRRIEISEPTFYRWKKKLSGTGEGYGDHVDDALMGRNPRLRSDVSVTVFLSDPDHHEGGKLGYREFGGRAASRPIIYSQPTAATVYAN